MFCVLTLLKANTLECVDFNFVAPTCSKLGLQRGGSGTTRHMLYVRLGHIGSGPLYHLLLLTGLDQTGGIQSRSPFGDMSSNGRFDLPPKRKHVSNLSSSVLQPGRCAQASWIRVLESLG